MSNTSDNDSGKQCFYYRVSGRVQGVFFRVATKSMADRFGVHGWVKNLPNGDVEGVASGDAKNVNIFLEWLKQGPEMARVLKLETQEREVEEHDSFEVR